VNQKGDEVVSREARHPKAKWAAVAACCAAVCGASASSAVAQGCAMCYQTAAASSAPGRDALRHGILILLIPAVSLFTGIFALIYRRRDLSR
jgi:hypothetical protein